MRLTTLLRRADPLGGTDHQLSARGRAGLRALVGPPDANQKEIHRTTVRNPPSRAGMQRWVGAGLAVAAVTTAALLLVPGMLGASRSVPAVPAEVPSQPVAEPVWVKIADSPLSPRYEARGVWVDGRYLLVSGNTDPCGPVESDCVRHPVWLADGALYDPAKDAWASISPAPLVTSLGEPVVLGDSVYFLTDHAEIPDELARTDRVLLRYQVDTNTWTRSPLPQKAGGRLVATDSAVIALSVSDLDGKVEELVFHPDTDSWSSLPDDPFEASDRDAVWAGGRLVLSATPLKASKSPARLAVMDASLSGWSKLKTTEPVYGSDPIAVGDRVVWKSNGDRYDVVDGKRTHEYYSSLNPITGQVTDIKAGFQRGILDGAWVASGRQVVIEGDLYNPTTGRWTTVPELGTLVSYRYTTQVGGEHSILLWGGNQSSGTDGRLLLLP